MSGNKVRIKCWSESRKRQLEQNKSGSSTGYSGKHEHIWHVYAQVIIPDGRQTRTLAPVARAKVFVKDEVVKVTMVTVVDLVVVVWTVTLFKKRAVLEAWRKSPFSSSASTWDDNSSGSTTSRIIFSSGITLASILWKNKIKSSVP